MLACVMSVMERIVSLAHAIGMFRNQALLGKLTRTIQMEGDAAKTMLLISVAFEPLLPRGSLYFAVVSL